MCELTCANIVLSHTITPVIPIADPVISKRADRYIIKTLRDGWISSKGPVVDRFEKKFAKFIHTNHAIATNSGTSSIHLALAALGIGPGDEVILPTFTMIATLLPVVYLGATPVLVDVEHDTGNIDCTLVKKALTAKTKAIIAVHIYGHPADMSTLLSIAGKRTIPVVEDAAEAHGAQYKSSSTHWSTVGSLGTAGCFSLYANKIITTGEGGIAVTNDSALAERMRSLSNFARAPGQHFSHTAIGYAYRMGSLQAALGLAQLPEAAARVKRKRQIAGLYSQQLRTIPGITLPIEKPYARSVFWHYGIIVTQKARRTRNELARFLAKNNIETRNFFVPLHRQPVLRKKNLVSGCRFPISDYLGTGGICLPSGLTITNKEILFICRKIRAFMDGNA